MLQSNFFLKFLIFLIFIGSQTVFASTSMLNSGAENEEDELVKRKYVLEYGALAIEEMQRSGVPASIVLAQGILESEWGRALLAKNNNNHFGIKCFNGWRGGCAIMPTNESDQGVILAGFRKYKYAEDSYLDHSELLMNDSRYQKIFDSDPNDYKRWAIGLKKSGYATDPLYAKKLIQIIERNQLYELDDRYVRAIPANVNDKFPLFRSGQKGPKVNTPTQQVLLEAIRNSQKKKRK